VLQPEARLTTRIVSNDMTFDYKYTDLLVFKSEFMLFVKKKIWKKFYISLTKTS
jgi:hypothetical protein